MLHQCDGFGESRHADGTVTATFHLQFVQHLDLPGSHHGFPFRIIHPRCDDPIPERVIGGFLVMDPEKVQFFGGLTEGECATLISITPEFCLSSKQHIRVDMTTSKGLFIRHPPGLDNPVIIDICSGIHGWSVGGGPYGFKPTVAVEMDELTADLGRRNLGHWLVDPERIFTANFSEVERWLERGVTIQGAFQDQRFWEKVSKNGIHVFVTSLPCPPWSELARAKGLGDIRGSLFYHLCFMANAFRPVAIVLENVRGLLFHKDWDCIRKMFGDVGFVVAHESIDPLSHILPVSRDRASIIMLNTSFAEQLSAMQVKPTPTPLLTLDQSPAVRGVFHDEIPEVIKPMVAIHPQDEERLVDFKMWPKDWKLRYPMVDSQTIDIRERAINRSKLLPCPVAKYAMPHLIDGNLLCDKGLYMKIIFDTQKCNSRWLSPCEIQCGLGFPWFFILKRDPELTYHVLGNSISPFHAALSIARLATVYPQVAPIKIDIFDALMQLIGNIPKLPKAFVDFDDEFFWLMPKLHPETAIVPAEDDTLLPLLTKRSAECVESSQVKKHKTLLNVESCVETPMTTDPYLTDGDRHCKQTDCFPLDFLQPLRLKVFCSNDFGEFFEWTHEGDGPCAIQDDDHFRFQPNGVWITGLHSRTSSLSQVVTHVDPEETLVMDFLGTWTCRVSRGSDSSIGEVIQNAFPPILQIHCQTIAADDIYVEWDDLCHERTSKIQIQFRKVKRVIHISGTKEVLSCFCDPTDTVRSLCHEHPNLKDSSEQHLVALEHSSVFDINGPFTLLRIGPDEPVLKHSNFVWSLVTVHNANQSDEVAGLEDKPIPSTQVDALSIHDSCDEEDSVAARQKHVRLDSTSGNPITMNSTIGVIHPSTGKFSELPITPGVCVVQLLDLLHPPVAPCFPCVAEINGKRIDLNLPVTGLDHSSTIRFRHYWALGGGPPVADCLKTELVARGVPVQQVDHRINAVLSAVGTKPIEDAFLTNDPWAKIKQTCSSKSVRLIMPGELKNHQANRRASSLGDRTTASTSSSSSKGKKGGGKGKGKSKGGKSQEGSTRAIPLPQWSEVDLPEGFVATDDTPLDYIDGVALQKDASGVCPLSFQEAEPYVMTNSKLSEDPLAIIVPGHHLQPNDDVHHISFPVTMHCDGAPMLMPATMFQLGLQPVFFSFRGPTAEIETTPSTVVEVQVNAELCPYWKAISKPLDILVQGVPMLRDKEVLLAHWSWKWLENRKMVAPAVATHLHGYLRVPDKTLEKILAASGPCGISMWPKSNSKQLDPRFSHIGVEAKGPDEVSAITKATNHTIGFVQSPNNKWLVRCRREHYPQTRAILVPTGLVLEDIPIGQHDIQYVLQSCTADLSCTTQAINKGLEDLGWNAKVVKSMGPSAWLVTSKEFPPHPHISLSGKIMSVTQHDGNRNPFVQFAPAKPAAHFATSVSNPWQNYVPTNVKESPPAGCPGPTATRFVDLEKSLQAKLDERLAGMEDKITKVTQEASKATTGCLKRIDNLENSVANKIHSVEHTIASNQQQLLVQMKQLFESYAPHEDSAKRPRKSDPPAPKE